METAIKTTLAQKNSEMKKLETSEKSHLRMIISSAARLKMKYSKTEDPNRVPKYTDAKNIRMYETHYPGFCYLRNGEYRKKASNGSSSSTPDPVQCSERVKEILFTNNELDVCKVMCLHLLGTQIQNKNHIQRKDGRLCSYLKAQTTGNTPQTLQSISLRINPHTYEPPTKFDKILPRYILDVRVPQQGTSTPSVKANDLDSGSDDETKKRRKVQVPIYINNEIRMIIISVLEALEAVNSPKMKALSDLASSPEELRNMLLNEGIQDYITELAANPLVTRPTSYDCIMTHVMLDKIPEKGTLETVAQVLEVYDNMSLKASLNLIRKGISQRRLELLNPNIQQWKKMGVQEKSSSPRSNFGISNPPVSPGVKYLVKPNFGEDVLLRREEFSDPPQKESREKENQKRKTSIKETSRNSATHLEKMPTNDPAYLIEQNENWTSSESFTRASNESIDYAKYDKNNLSNSQRILLGLKVASLKCKPLNMHQFEGKKKIDMGAIISPIIKPQITDIDYSEHSSGNSLKNFSPPERQVRSSTSRASTIQASDLENLTRALLANLRLDISETENKKRVTQFITSI